MNVSLSVKNWYEGGGREKIREYMDDVDGILSTDNGSKKGVYGAYVVTMFGKEILMYIGEVGKDGRCLRDRFVEHAKYWIESPELYTGVLPSELENGYHHPLLPKCELNIDTRFLIQTEGLRYKVPEIQSNT